MSRTYIMHLGQWFSAHLCQKGPHLKICKTRRRLQPKLLNGILSRVQLRGNDANSRKHREAAVVNLMLLRMVAAKHAMNPASQKPNRIGGRMLEATLRLL